MNDEKPKRRAWFQLHLSTCVVLMVVAGVLVWANVHTYLLPDYSWNVSGNPDEVESPETWRCFGEARGWPKPYRTAASDELLHENWPNWLRREKKFGKSNYRVLDGEASQSRIILSPTDWFDFTMWSMKSIAIDAFVALALLALTAFACEYATRRRERKRLSSSDSQLGSEIKSAFL